MDEGLGFPNKDFSMLGSILRSPPPVGKLPPWMPEGSELPRCALGGLVKVQGFWVQEWCSGSPA